MAFKNNSISAEQIEKMSDEEYEAFRKERGENTKTKYNKFHGEMPKTYLPYTKDQYADGMEKAKQNERFGKKIKADPQKFRDMTDAEGQQFKENKGSEQLKIAKKYEGPVPEGYMKRSSYLESLNKKK